MKTKLLKYIRKRYQIIPNDRFDWDIRYFDTKKVELRYANSITDLVIQHYRDMMYENRFLFVVALNYIASQIAQTKEKRRKGSAIRAYQTAIAASKVDQWCAENKMRTIRDLPKIELQDYIITIGKKDERKHS